MDWKAVTVLGYYSLWMRLGFEVPYWAKEIQKAPSNGGKLRKAQHKCKGHSASDNPQEPISLVLILVETEA